MSRKYLYVNELAVVDARAMMMRWRDESRGWAKMDEKYRAESDGLAYIYMYILYRMT